MSEQRAITAAPDAALTPLDRVLDAGLTPEAMANYLATFERMQAVQAEQQFTAAFVAMKRTLPEVIKRDMRVSYGNTRYTHASLAAVVEGVTPHLVKFGFAHRWSVENDPASKLVTVTSILSHEGGHSERTSMSAPPDTSGNKNPGQQAASTATLLERHTLLAQLGIATADQKDVPQSKPIDPAAIDPARNRAAAEWLTKQGLDPADYEAEVGRTSDQWTGADLENVKAWAGEQNA